MGFKDRMSLFSINRAFSESGFLLDEKIHGISHVIGMDGDRECKNKDDNKSLH